MRSYTENSTTHFSQTAAPAAVLASSTLRTAILRVLGMLLLALALMSLARAGNITVTLDPNWSDYGTYSYTVAGVTYTRYTGPYEATLTGGIYGSGTLAYLSCFDINVDTNIGTLYTGSLTAPTGKTQLEVAWLMNQLGLAGGYYAPLSTTGPIGMAIWQLEDPSSINPAPFVEDPAAQPWVTNAVNAVTSGAWTAADAAQQPFWTPDNLSAAQRFGIVELAHSAPEPGSFALVGASLIGVGLLLRKRLTGN